MEYEAQGYPEEDVELAAELNRSLHPHVLQTYSYFGLTLHTVDLHYLRTVADEILGPGKWSWVPIQYETITMSVDSDGKTTIGIMCQGRLALSKGSFHDEIGFGYIEKCAGSPKIAFQRCCKYAEDDCLRRCLRLLGNSLGACLYEKEYIGFAENIGKNL